MKDWYLMNNYKPNATSGYESDVISDFAEDNFADVLETTFSDTVLLYNSSLSESKSVKCIIQGNSPDTQLNALKCTALFPIGTVDTGMYVYYDNSYWLVVGNPRNNKCYEKVVMQVCQFCLRWQNDNGDIVERWVYSEDFTKYSSGIKSNERMTLGDNQYGLMLPVDTETKKLKRDMRFPIDFDDAVEPEIYKLTNRKAMLNNSGDFKRGGTITLTLTLSEFNESTDKKVTMPDGKEVWICNYNTPSLSDDTDASTGSESNITFSISGDKSLKVGFARTYTAVITDENGNMLEWSDEYQWCINGDVDVDCAVNNGAITLFTDDSSIIGEMFTLEIYRNTDKLCELEINIVGTF